MIKLDLRLLGERDPADLARVVTAVGAEAERRHATVLAEGIDTRGGARARARRRARRSARATCSASRRRCPTPLPDAGPAAAARGRGRRTLDGPLPYQRVTNWKRPVRGPLALAERAAALLTEQAAALGPTGMLLAAPDALRTRRRASRRCATRSASSACSSPGALEDTWTEVALGPGFGACFVARRDGDELAVRDVLRPRAGRRVRAAAHGAAAAAPPPR